MVLADVGHTDYETMFREFLYGYSYYFTFVDSVSDYGDYDKPISQNIGSIFDFSFRYGETITKNFLFEQMLIET